MPRVIHGDNLAVLPTLGSGSIDLVYIDPPFNTGKVQTRVSLRTRQAAGGGDRTGFGGRRYRSEATGSTRYLDAFDDYLAFLAPRLEEIHRVLTARGSLLFHIDYREAHYCKVLLDSIFGREAFINEIIWAYDYGGRSKSRWPAKHDTILWYARDPRNYTFRYDDIDRIPYRAPGLAGPEKAARGKTPTDVWWHTIVSPTGREKTGYATQKPLGIVERIVRVHSNPGEMVLDCFAGSGTLGEAAGRLGRDFILVDDNPEAMAVMQRRLARFEPTFERWGDSAPASA